MRLFRRDERAEPSLQPGAPDPTETNLPISLLSEEVAVVPVAEQATGAINSFEELVSAHESELEEFATARRDAKLAIGAVLQPEWRESWKSFVRNSTLHQNVRPDITPDRREMRKNRGFYEAWDERVVVTVTAARMQAGRDAIKRYSVMQTSGRGLDQDVDEVLETYGYSFEPSDYDFAEAETMALFSADHMLHRELVELFTTEEHQAARVLDALIEYAGTDLAKWEEIARKVNESAAEAMSGRHTPTSLMTRIIAEDLHDPQRGKLRAAVERLKSTNAQELLGLFIESLDGDGKLSSQEKLSREALQYGAALLNIKTDDPLLPGALLGVHSVWPQALRDEFSAYSAEYVESIIDDMAQPTPRLATAFSKLPRPEQLAALFTQDEAKPSAQTKRKSLGMAAVKGMLASAGESEPEPSFTYLIGSPDKEAVKLDEKTERAIITRLVDKMGGNGQLRTDLERIMAAFKASPFAKGTTKISEVGKLEIPRGGTPVKGSLYRINVINRPGVSTSTAAAKDVRLLFVQSDKDVVLLGLYTHDDYEAAIRNLR